MWHSSLIFGDFKVEACNTFFMSRKYWDCNYIIKGKKICSTYVVIWEKHMKIIKVLNIRSPRGTYSRVDVLKYRGLFSHTCCLWRITLCSIQCVYRLHINWAFSIIGVFYSVQHCCTKYLKLILWWKWKSLVQTVLESKLRHPILNVLKYQR